MCGHVCVCVCGLLLEAKRQAHNRVLHTNSITSRREFQRHQRIVKLAVDDAKEGWILGVARKAESAKKDGRQRWKSIRQLQMGLAGRRPKRPTALLKSDGVLTSSLDEVKTTWHQHFSRVLNIPSSFIPGVIEEQPTLSPDLELDGPPSMEEVWGALGKLKMGKAGGKTGILPELLRAGGIELFERMHKVMVRVWEEGEAVSDWKDSEIVPIPKKGNLQLCDNWRGISLLDVVGKVFARVLQERLLAITERVLPKSQCGFRKGRGCVDMIFVARQLVEKSREHETPLFVLFVDLKKAYDSIPRCALWRVLEKYGVPPTMLSVIRSLHDGMKAAVRVEGGVTDNISVTNGLRQGCTLAPSLFNLYFGAMVSSWRSKCPDAGVTVMYKHGRKLVGDRTAKSRLQEAGVTESQFADDVAVYTISRAAFRMATAKFVSTAAEWGLTVSLEKTKGLAMGKHLEPSDVLPVQVADGAIEVVRDFTYLGSIISDDGEIGAEVSTRIGRASRAFGCLQRSIFQNHRLTIATKREVYKATVLSVLLYGTETWAIKAHSLKRMSGFHNRCVRTIMSVTKRQQWQQRITSRELASAFGMTETMAELLRRHRLRWLGHVARMDACRLPKQLLFGELEKPRPRHGVKRRWRDLVLADIRAMGIEDWYTSAQDRGEWAALCRGAGMESTGDGTCTANISQPTDASQCPCGRTFRRRGDLTRHSHFCDGVRQARRSPSPDSHLCACGRSFRRRGDISRHKRFCTVAL